MLANASIGVSALFLASLSIRAQSDTLPTNTELAPLVLASMEVARTGDVEASREVLAAITALGVAGGDLNRHRRTVEQSLQQSPSAGAASRAARLLRDAVSALGPVLARQSGDNKTHFAEILLRLDSEFALAHEALGHELLASQWHLPGESRRNQNRRDHVVALDRARRLDVPMQSGVSDESLLTKIVGRECVCVRTGSLEMHSVFPAARAERIVRQTLRAAAYVNYLVTGSLRVPDYGRQKFLIFRTRQEYLDAITALESKGLLAEAHVGVARNARSWRLAHLDPMLQVAWFDMDVDAEAMWLTTMEYWSDTYPTLIAGRTNLACHLVLGVPMPRMTEVIVKARKGEDGRTTTDASADERARLEALSAAGMHGGRAWMRFLVREGEAPPWTATLHSQTATIAGDELLKATLMVEFLAEEGRLQGLAEAAQKTGKPEQADALAEALGEPLAEIDRRWAGWLLGFDLGVRQRIQVKSSPTAAELRGSGVLATVQRLRAKAGVVGDLGYDVDLAAGCREHALYLRENSDQLASFPELHEEYPDRPAWTSVGSKAGHGSVIVSGVKSDEQAMATWMATFYHRIPLLQFGLRCIGYAREGGIAVLDCGSMVEHRTDLVDQVVMWPHDGMTDTPTRFAGPELPNPVPGENQEKFGYPITLQCSARSCRSPIDLVMTLRENNERGPEVPCWFSSPQAPSNPQVAPANTFCLIPKAPLKKGANYFVTAKFISESTILHWVFRT